MSSNKDYPLIEEISLLKDKELVYKHSETGSNLVSLDDAIRCLERLEIKLLNYYKIPR